MEPSSLVDFWTAELRYHEHKARDTRVALHNAIIAETDHKVGDRWVNPSTGQRAVTIRLYVNYMHTVTPVKVLVKKDGTVGTREVSVWKRGWVREE